MGSWDAGLAPEGTAVLFLTAELEQRSVGALVVEAIRGSKRAASSRGGQGGEGGEGGEGGQGSGGSGGSGGVEDETLGGVGDRWAAEVPTAMPSSLLDAVAAEAMRDAAMREELREGANEDEDEDVVAERGQEGKGEGTVAEGDSEPIIRDEWIVPGGLLDRLERGDIRGADPALLNWLGFEGRAEESVEMGRLRGALRAAVEAGVERETLVRMVEEELERIEEIRGDEDAEGLFF